MAIADFLNRNSVENGINAKYDRKNKFRLSRFNDKQGFHVYILENLAKSQKICIQRFMFDRFRATIKELRFATEKTDEAIKQKIYYKTDTYYHIVTDKSDPQNLLIQEMKLKRMSTGHITIDRKALKTIEELLYHELLRHPNDVLDRIIAYHRLFQFTFGSV